MLLVSFIGILWALSSQLVFVFDGHHFTIPGYMVWCAILYALIGSLLTWRVGVPLIGLNAELYAREAELRFALVRVSESAESIALFGGEQDERRQLEGNLDRVITAMRRLSGALSRLTWITSGYGWIAIVVPIVVASPGYFSGGLTTRRLDDGGRRLQPGAGLAALVRRPVSRRSPTGARRCTGSAPSRPRSTSSTRSTSAIDTSSWSAIPRASSPSSGVSVLLSDGRVVIAEATVEIGRGERVLIVGESGAGKSTLFRALAGLWPWGSGTIRLPAPDSMMFMPQRPYLPLGTMRARDHLSRSAGRLRRPPRSRPWSSASASPSSCRCSMSRRAWTRAFRSASSS